MRTNHSKSKEREVNMTKYLNSKSGRQPQNNPKLANLLNLSYHNLHDQTKNPPPFFKTLNKPDHKPAEFKKFNIHQPDIIPDLSKPDSPRANNGNKTSKTKRSKSSKRNILSCQQILSMGKKRQTFAGQSARPLYDPSRAASSNQFQNKNKRKNNNKIGVRNQNNLKISSNTTKNMKLIHNREWHSSLNNYESLQNKEAFTENNLVVNYPLSMSHSYIVFSEKDSTMNNTNIIYRRQKKLSNALPEFDGFHDKLFTIRASHAAVVIQKHWRGYLTRKLLDDCINNEQPKLTMKLSDFKIQKAKREKNQSLNCSEANFLQDQQSECSRISQIKQKDSQQSASYQEQSHENSSFAEDEFGLQAKSEKKPIKLSTRQQLNLLVSIPSFPTKENESSSQKNIELICLNFGEEIQKLINNKLEDEKKLLGEQLKSSMIQFQEMLQRRQQLKVTFQTLNSKITNFLSEVTSNFYQISKSNSKTSTLKIQQFLTSNNNKLDLSRTCKQIESQLCGQPIPTQQEIPTQMLHNPSQCSSQHITNSPISEYFTIELPTEELSPHKKIISPGLESLRTYLENLHQQFVEESENNDISQTGFLCSILKRHSQIGPQNMIQRCLIQMLVEMLTNQHLLENILNASNLLVGEGEDTPQKSNEIEFVRKWAHELDKWQLGTIYEVSRNMQESADVTERNTSNRKIMTDLKTNFYDL